MNGGMEQLSRFLLSSWFVTFFWISDTCKNLMKNRETFFRKGKCT